MDALLELVERREVQAAVVAVGSILVAFLAELIIRVTLGALARRTASDLDDRVAAALRRPVFLSVIFIGLGWSADLLATPDRFLSVTHSVLETLAVLIWSAAAFSVGTAVLETLSRRAGESSIVQPRTLPVFEILIRLLVIGAAVYFTFLAWDIDVTAWLASAGIIGIAVGFAAKDTLANFFAGIFIIADAPYKVGDWIVLDGDLRGRVIKIGVRSTRLLTSDDIEITVPNSVIGASKIVNEVGGPSIKQRIRVKVQCAYGVDIDQVRAVLIDCADGDDEVAREPAPQVNLNSFGDSGLNVELRVWIEDPARRDAIIDRLNTRVYKAFAAHQIEIPYPKRDLYIKQQARPG
ncbi:MAG TPA: mechanosensitive ion channel family protein [Kofleriaceae bacterium]|nr:mechanosensitive ion channel family protein [Kofleriaceae bacterium]